jgi:uncharacterized membrane-anchored protein YjiN (DUF445 family)
VLVVMTGVFLAVTLFTSGRGWAGYVQAFAEASMVGGLADWFAVTALFRRPLGLPIPHTAVISERKDQFGATLGEFVQQNFLSADNIAERVRAFGPAERGAAWLTEPENAELLARHVLNSAIAIADLVRDEDVHRVLAEEIEAAVDALPVTVIAARALRLMTAQPHSDEILSTMLHAIETFLDDNQATLRDRFGAESPWWLPGAVEDRIFERLLDGVRTLLRDAATQPDHVVRVRFHEWLDDFVDRLEHSPDMQARGEEVKRELLEHAELRSWTSSMWAEVKAALRSQASDPDSKLRKSVAGAVTAVGQRLATDDALRSKVDELAESGVRSLANQFHEEAAELISGTIARWDTAQASRKLEVLLGRDLQFIRINGTVVGGLAGVAIHLVSQSLR